MIELFNNVGFIWMGFWILLIYTLYDIFCFKLPILIRKVINHDNNENK